MWIHQTTYKEDADEFRERMEREAPTFTQHYKLTDHDGKPVWRFHSPNYPCDWCPGGDY
jgi:hypothetical protein